MATSPLGLDLARADSILFVWGENTENEVNEIREYLHGIDISFQSARVRNGNLEFVGVEMAEPLTLPCLIVFQNIHYLSSQNAPHRIFFIQGSRNIRKALGMEESSDLVSDIPYPPIRVSLDLETDY